MVPSGVDTNVKGSEGTTDYRLFFTADGQNVSPWHDVPLYVDGEDGMVWMVTEIPKMTKPKMECATDEPSNPIKQDSKKGKLRDYHGPIFWNYGFLPRTWEDPGKTEDVKGAGSVAGDNDPVDVVEIGTRAHAQGEIVKVKVLGSLAMIDEGELDWKVIAIAADDPLAKELDDSKSLAEKCPEVISGIREWFRWYKTPDGKPLNSFGFDEETVSTAETLEVIQETHKQYKDLLTRKDSDLWLPQGGR